MVSSSLIWMPDRNTQESTPAVMPERFYQASMFLLFLFLPPLAGGSARVPCQIIDLAGWEREGDFSAKGFFRVYKGALPPYTEEDALSSSVSFSPFVFIFCFFCF